MYELLEILDNKNMIVVEEGSIEIYNKIISSIYVLSETYCNYNRCFDFYNYLSKGSCRPFVFNFKTNIYPNLQNLVNKLNYSPIISFKDNLLLEKWKSIETNNIENIHIGNVFIKEFDKYFESMFDRFDRYKPQEIYPLFFLEDWNIIDKNLNIYYSKILTIKESYKKLLESYPNSIFYKIENNYIFYKLNYLQGFELAYSLLKENDRLFLIPKHLLSSFICNGQFIFYPYKKFELNTDNTFIPSFSVPYFLVSSKFLK